MKHLYALSTAIPLMYKYSLVPGKHLNTFASAIAAASTAPTILPPPPSAESGTAAKHANLLNKERERYCQTCIHLGFHYMNACKKKKHI